MSTSSDKPRWMMHGITSDPVENYLYSLLPDRDEVLREMETQAAKRDIALSKAAALVGLGLDPEKAGKMFPIEWRK